jgi:hypothetical protein
MNYVLAAQVILIMSVMVNSRVKYQDYFLAASGGLNLSSQAGDEKFLHCDRSFIWFYHCASSFDYFVSSSQDVWRNRQADLLCGS